MKNTHGGARQGAGRKKGGLNKATMAKAEAREYLRQRLTQEVDVFADALMSRARGVRYFVTRNKKTGKYELVTNPDQVIAALNGEDENTGEFYTDKPDVQAIREGLDRIADKPTEQVEAKVTTQVADMSDEDLRAAALKHLGLGHLIPDDAVKH